MFLKGRECILEITKLHPECISCLIDKHIGKFSDTSETERILYIQSLLKILSEAEITESAPEVVAKIEKMQCEMFGRGQEYTEIKRHFNSLMLGYEKELSDRISRSDNPFKAAAVLSMLGNYIDFGAMDSVDEKRLCEMLWNTDEVKINETELLNLRCDLEKASRLVFLTDNCGEIVTDKIFLECIGRLYPGLEITAMVRGFPVLNDATYDDAVFVGIDKIASVVGNGSNVAGTALSEISDEAKRIIDGADVIIAKGQGNFETLSGCGKNIYYMFLCKCIMFAKRFGVERYTGMLINDTRMN